MLKRAEGLRNTVEWPSESTWQLQNCRSNVYLTGTALGNITVLIQSITVLYNLLHTDGCYCMEAPGHLHFSNLHPGGRSSHPLVHLIRFNAILIVISRVTTVNSTWRQRLLLASLHIKTHLSVKGHRQWLRSLHQTYALVGYQPAASRLSWCWLAIQWRRELHHNQNQQWQEEPEVINGKWERRKKPFHRSQL